MPQLLWPIIQSSDNLSPRGLQNTFATNIDDLDAQSIDTYLIGRSKRESAEEKKSSEA